MDFESQKKVDEYLMEHYKNSSHATIRGAIKNHLFERYKIENYRDITYSVYLKLKEDAENMEFDKSAFSNCEYFIKYIQANGELNNDVGFINEWIVKNELKYFEGRRNKLKGLNKNVKTDNEGDILSIVDLSKIKQFLEINTENAETYKTQFTWFLLFDIGLNINDVKRIKLSKDYEDGILSLPTGDRILISDRFHKHLEKHKKSKYDSFYEVNKWMKRLGEKLEIEITLKPKVIKNTREKLLIECSSCFNVFLRDVDNWIAVGGWIVCKECANKLKKKDLISNLDKLENLEIESDFKVNKQVFISYEELKEEILKTPIDYLKLHEFQIAIGDLGEQYVYEYEVSKLEGTELADLVDKSKAKNNSNGYDILSYTLDGRKVHIEVKTTSTLINEFYISQHELEVARKMIEKGEIYKVYFVKDIMGNPQLEIIDDILSEKEYRKEGNSWKMIKECIQ